MWWPRGLKTSLSTCPYFPCIRKPKVLCKHTSNNKNEYNTTEFLNTVTNFNFAGNLDLCYFKLSCSREIGAVECYPRALSLRKDWFHNISKTKPEKHFKGCVFSHQVSEISSVESWDVVGNLPHSKWSNAVVRSVFEVDSNREDCLGYSWTARVVKLFKRDLCTNLGMP